MGTQLEPLIDEAEEEEEEESKEGQ
jgi:hypothetical protein